MLKMRPSTEGVKKCPCSAGMLGLKLWLLLCFRPINQSIHLQHHQHQLSSTHFAQQIFHAARNKHKYIFLHWDWSPLDTLILQHTTYWHSFSIFWFTVRGLLHAPITPCRHYKPLTLSPSFITHHPSRPSPLPNTVESNIRAVKT